MNDRSDLFIAILAIAIAVWSLVGAVFLPEIYLRWNIARSLLEKRGRLSVRFLYLALFLLMAFSAYRIYAK